MTILGDKAQTLDETMQDVLLFLPKIFGKKMRTIVLNKSYRNTVEIATYAGAINQTTDLELLDRHGKAVEEVYFSEEESMLKAIGENLSVGENGYETAAVIAMTEEKARELYELLNEEEFRRLILTEIPLFLNAGLQLQHFIWRKDWNLIRFSACLKRKKIL
jgi:Superfamily I DNA and RNA helicases